MPSYTEEQKRIAIEAVEECGGSVTQARLPHAPDALPFNVADQNGASESWHIECESEYTFDAYCQFGEFSRYNAYRETNRQERGRMAWLNDSFRLRGDDRIAYENRRGLFLAILIAVFAAGVGVSGLLLIVSALYNYVAFYAAVALMVCVSLLIFTHSTKEDIEFREAKDRRESEALAEREKALNGMDDEFNHVIMLQLSLKQLLDQLQEWFGKHEYYAAVFYGREAPSILAYAERQPGLAARPMRPRLEGEVGRPRQAEGLPLPLLRRPQQARAAGGSGVVRKQKKSCVMRRSPSPALLRS